MEKKEIDLTDILNCLKRRWMGIASVAAISVVVTIIITFCLITPKYTATTKLFIGKENIESISSQKDRSYDSSDIQMYQQILQTYADILKTRTLISNVIEENNVNLKSNDVLKNLVVKPKENTQIIEVTYKDDNPYLAKEMLELISTEFINYSAELIPNANVQVVEDVFLPEKASSPNKPLNIVIGLFAGIILGLLLALFLEYIDDTFEDKKKLEKEIGIIVIGDIPKYGSA